MQDDGSARRERRHLAGIDAVEPMSAAIADAGEAAAVPVDPDVEGR